MKKLFLILLIWGVNSQAAENTASIPNIDKIKKSSAKDYRLKAEMDVLIMDIQKTIDVPSVETVINTGCAENIAIASDNSTVNQYIVNYGDNSSTTVVCNN